MPDARCIPHASAGCRMGDAEGGLRLWYAGSKAKDAE